MAKVIFENQMLKIVRLDTASHVVSMSSPHGYNNVENYVGLTQTMTVTDLRKLAIALAKEVTRIQADEARRETIAAIDPDLDDCVPPREIEKELHSCVICERPDKVQLRAVGGGEFSHICDFCWPTFRANMRV